MIRMGLNIFCWLTEFQKFVKLRVVAIYEECIKNFIMNRNAAFKNKIKMKLNYEYL